MPETPAPPQSPPAMSRDFAFFFEGLKQRQLLAQRCDACDVLRHPPQPMCPKCNSFDWTAQPLSGAGRVYSYTVHYYPPIPPHTAPHPMVLVDMDEGVRVFAAFEGGEAGELRIGLPVRTTFAELGPDFVLHRFEPDRSR